MSLIEGVCQHTFIGSKSLKVANLESRRHLNLSIQANTSCLVVGGMR